MTDTWREYFIPVPVMGPSAEDLLSVQKLDRNEKDEIEWMLSSPIHLPRFDEAMQRLHRMLPDTVFVIAASYAQARDFGAAVRKQIRYVSSPENLMGLDNIHIVFLGNYMAHQFYRDFIGILMTRRNVTRWDIREWTHVRSINTQYNPRRTINWGDI